MPARQFGDLAPDVVPIFDQPVRFAILASIDSTFNRGQRNRFS
jgi:hypothetical protein